MSVIGQNIKGRSSFETFWRIHSPYGKGDQTLIRKSFIFEGVIFLTEGDDVIFSYL